MGWYGVDFDGTLATYTGWQGPTVLGDPVPKMVERVKKWVAEGKDVRLMTARWNCPLDDADTKNQVELALLGWMNEHLGFVLPITQTKDYQMIELWDDRAVQVEKNTGRRVDEIVHITHCSGCEGPECPDGYFI